MNALVRVIRAAIAASLLGTLAAAVAGPKVCYLCQPDTLAYLVVLHLMLFAGTFARNKVMPILVLTLLVFYASRVAVIQLNPDYFTYVEFLPSPEQMTQVVFALLLISGGMLFGCAVGGVLGTGYRGPLGIVPFSYPADNTGEYYAITGAYIASCVVLLGLLPFGIGLPIPTENASPILLRAALIARTFGGFGIIPVAWFLIRKPAGVERRVTIAAIVLLVLSTVGTLSKVSLIQASLPFLFVYYASGRRVPRRVLFRVALIILVVAVVVASLVMAVRRALTTGSIGHFTLISSQGFTIKDNVLALLQRIGTSFDVLSLMVTNTPAFEPFRNLPAEFKAVFASLYPGGVAAINPPRWAQLVPSIGHGTDLDALLRYGTGENITFPAHMYLYFGLAGSVLGSFLFMMGWTLVYRYSKTVTMRVFLLSTVLYDISNGGGFIGMITEWARFGLWFLLMAIGYRVYFGRALRRRRGAPQHAVALPRY